MNLEADQTGTLNEGASAADGENWAISWRPAAEGITITYERLPEKYGKGRQAGLAPGRTFTARFTTGETGKQILSTSAIPPEPDRLIQRSHRGVAVVTALAEIPQ